MRMEIKKVMVDDRELDFIVSGDDLVEENDKVMENDTLDLTDVIEYVREIIESSDING